MKRFLVLVVLALIGVAVYGVVQTSRTPENLYTFTKVFAACPARPSCVSSMAEDDVHRVAALGYSGEPARASVMLREVVERMGGKIEHEAPDYIHAVFVTPTMRYRDDLELLVLPEGRIEVRSISRFGYRDFGVNRDRVEELRGNFEAQP